MTRARVHVANAMGRIASHPVQPRDVHDLVSALVWDGDKVSAYWLAEEMMNHPRLKLRLTGTSYETYAYWLGVWSVLGDVLTEKQRKAARPEQKRERAA